MGRADQGDKSFSRSSGDGRPEAQQKMFGQQIILPQPPQEIMIMEEHFPRFSLSLYHHVESLF